MWKSTLNTVNRDGRRQKGRDSREDQGVLATVGDWICEGNCLGLVGGAERRKKSKKQDGDEYLWMKSNSRKKERGTRRTRSDGG